MLTIKDSTLKLRVKKILLNKENLIEKVTILF